MRSFPVRRAWVLVLFLASGAGLAACGSDNSSSSAAKAKSTPAPASGGGGGGGGGGAQTLKLSATEQGGLSFDKKKLTAKAGSVTLVMANPGSDKAPHGIAIEGKGVDKDGKVVQPGDGDSTVTAQLKPGTYTFYCPVPGHRAAGMEGTLTVQ